MSQAYETLIREMPLFRGFAEAGARRLIEQGRITQHATGERLCCEGDPANHVLLILSGKLRAFVERDGIELVLGDFGPGIILGDVAVLCGIARAASVRVLEPSVVLNWTDQAYRSLLLGDAFLSQRIFKSTLGLLIENERSLIESLMRKSRPASPASGKA
jgi:CRP-like cAMP-binding protein